MANPSPEAEGIDLTDPLIEYPPRDQEISAEYVDAADNFVRGLPKNFRFTHHAFILDNMDPILGESQPRNAVSNLTQRFKSWQAESLQCLHETPTENNIRVALTMQRDSLGSLYDSVIIGLDEMLDGLDGLTLGESNWEYMNREVQKWERFSHIAGIAAAAENRN